MRIPTATELDQRLLIVKQALGWLGTPYQHMGDVKGSGCDCGMLLVRAFVDSGLVTNFDPRPYPADWHLHQNGERYLGFVFERTAETDAPLFGDVAVFRYGRTYSHGGIVVAWPNIVHASAPARTVLLEDISKSPFATRPVRFFSLWPRGGRPS